MALNFPPTPANGDVYGTYMYSSAINAWRSFASGTGVAITSNTQPTSATNGDIWFKPVSGTFYIYTSDGVTGKWNDATGTGKTFAIATIYGG